MQGQVDRKSCKLEGFRVPPCLRGTFQIPQDGVFGGHARHFCNKSDATLAQQNIWL